MKRDPHAVPPAAVPRSGQVAIVILFATALVASIWWLLADREPTRREMTFAYRKHIVAISPDRNAQVLLDIAKQAHTIELIKQRCNKLQAWIYRCEAKVLMGDGPPENLHMAESAIYTHDGKGWKFESPVRR